MSCELALDDCFSRPTWLAFALEATPLMDIEDAAFTCTLRPEESPLEGPVKSPEEIVASANLKPDESTSFWAFA